MIINLPSVSLVAVDCVYLDATIRAMVHCMKQTKFANAFLLTHDERPLPAGITRIPIYKIESIELYSEFMIRTLPAHRKAFAEYILTVQHDGYVVRPEAWEARFQDFDYIGAPWCNGHVGNGGFSLRSQRLLEALTLVSIDDPHPEDWRIGMDYRGVLEHQWGIRFAPWDVAHRFSVENEPYVNSFGFHGLYTQSTLPITARV